MWRLCCVFWAALTVHLQIVCDENIQYSWIEAPVSLYWYQTLDTYVKNTQCRICPSLSTQDPGYGRDQNHLPYRAIYSASVYTIGQLSRPAEVFMFSDSFPTAGWNTMYTYCPYENPTLTNCIPQRHNGGANHAFFDGHVKWMSWIDSTGGSNNSVQWLHTNPS